MKIVLADLFYFNRLTQNRLCVPLNVGYIASYTKKIFHNEVDICIIKDPEVLNDYLNSNKPDVVGFSFYYWNQNLNYHYVKLIRQIYGKDVLIVWGGPSVDSIEIEHQKLNKKFPEVDIFVEGEGEAGFSEIIGRYLNNRKHIFDTPISSTFSFANGYLRGQDISSNLDLSQIPSPYLNGSLDEFLKKSYFPLLQATRTCPYQCTFCVSGKDRNKLRAFPIDQVYQEIDYIAYWNRDRPHVILNLAELNFGINKQDPEIARYIRKAKETIGYPKSVYFYSDKRFTETSRKVMEELGDINRDGLVFSLQSDHHETLKSIKRKNLPDEVISNGIEWASERNIPVTTEVIFGLPFESYESMVLLLEKSVNQGFDSIMLHNLYIMEGVELNRDLERILHGMKTKYRLLGSNYGTFNGKMIFEFEKVVTSNKYFSFEDFIKIRSLNLMFFSVFQGGYFKLFFQFARANGISIVRLFDYFMNPDNKIIWPKGYIEFVKDFKESCHEELHDDLESLGKTAEKIFKIKNDVGEPVRLNPYFYSRLMYREQEWTCEVFSRIFNLLSPDLINSSEIQNNLLNILEISRKSVIDLRNPFKNSPTNTSNYDLVEWKKNKFRKHISDFKKNGVIVFKMSDNQRLKLDSFLRSNQHLNDSDFYFVAVETIFPRADLFYEMEFCSATRNETIKDGLLPL